MKTKDENIFEASGCVSRDSMERKLASTLNSSENQLFDEHIKQCPLCKEAYEGYLACSVAIPTEKEFAEKFEKKFVNKRKRIVNISIVSTAIAACLILLFIVTPLIKNSFSSSYEQFLSEFNEAENYQLAEFNLDKPIPQSLQNNAIDVDVAMEIEDETIVTLSPIHYYSTEEEAIVEEVEMDDLELVASSNNVDLALDNGAQEDELTYDWVADQTMDCVNVASTYNSGFVNTNASANAKMNASYTYVNAVTEETYNTVVVTDVTSLYTKGLEYFNIGKYNKAITEFNQVIAIDNYHINALYYKAYSLSNLNKLEQAVELINFIENSGGNISLDMQTRLSLLRKEINNKKD